MRTILNLKYLNKRLTYNHFKMESLSRWIQNHTAKLLDGKCKFKRCILQCAYTQTRKYLKFQWLGKIYKFLEISNWYSEAMRIFTKILKPPFSVLRKHGLLSVIFVNDLYLQGAIKEQCNQTANATINLLTSLGFTIHTKKSVLEPVQSIEFLGFVIDSTTISVKINTDKSKIILNKIETSLPISNPKSEI